MTTNEPAQFPSAVAVVTAGGRGGATAPDISGAATKSWDQLDPCSSDRQGAMVPENCQNPSQWAVPGTNHLMLLEQEHNHRAQTRSQHLLFYSCRSINISS